MARTLATCHRISNCSENISRFGDVDPEKVVAAAKVAGVHELILNLPKGYDTVIGGAGGVLSGGQRQRIGLARAIYGSPKYLVLDEPNSNLDDQGERELVEAIRRIKAAGATVIVITHRTMVLQCVTKFWSCATARRIALVRETKCLQR